MHRVYIAASTQKHNVGVGNYGTEEKQMQLLADKVAALLKTQKKFQVFRNEAGWTLGQTVKDCNNLACEIFIDNHTNAGPEKAEGTVVFHLEGSTKGKLLAEFLYKNISPLSPGKDRGIKTETFYVLKNTKAPAVLIEHFFHTNAVEVEDFLKDSTRYAIAEATAICEYFGEKFILKKG